MVTCTFPEEWLKSAIYPIALDPAVVSYNARCAVQDAYTCSKEPGTTHTGNSSNILRLTKNSTNWGQCICFFKFNESVLPDLDASDYIVYGEFRVSTAQSGYPTSAFAGTVREVTSSWTLTTLTHNNIAGGWTHLFWHKGVKLSGKLLRQVEAILYTVIDDEE